MKSPPWEWAVDPDIPSLLEVLVYVEAIRNIRGLSESDTLGVLMDIVVADGLVKKDFEPETLLHLVAYFRSASDEQAREFCSSVVEWGEEEILLQRVSRLYMRHHHRLTCWSPVLMNDNGVPWRARSMRGDNAFDGVQMQIVPVVLQGLVEADLENGATWFSDTRLPSPRDVQEYINTIVKMVKFREISKVEIFYLIFETLNDYGKDVLNESTISNWEDCLCLLQRAPSQQADKICETVMAWGEREYTANELYEKETKRPVLRNWKGSGWEMPGSAAIIPMAALVIWRVWRSITKV